MFPEPPSRELHSRVVVLGLLLALAGGLAPTCSGPEGPPRVEGLVCRAKPGKIDLVWQALDGATGYRVRRYEGATASLVGEPDGTVFADFGLLDGETYTYTVSAALGDGAESEPSDPCAATPAGRADSNLPPDIVSTPVTSGQVGSPYAYDVDAVDPEDEPLGYALAAGPAGMGIDPATGLISWTPGPADGGEHVVTVRATDPGGLADAQSYRVVVAAPPNGPPEITSLPSTEARVGEPYSYDVEATDPDGDPLVFALDSGPAGMEIDAATGLLDWTPDLVQVGAVGVVVRASDPEGLFDEQAFTIDVTAPGNRPPVVQALLSDAVRAPERFQVFFGEDPNPTENPDTPGLDDPLRPASLPASTAARDRFLRELAGDVPVEGFEDLDDGEIVAALDFDGTRATVASDARARHQPSGTFGGAYPTSGETFLLAGSGTTGSLFLSFDGPVGAFGLGVTDAGDGSGPLRLVLSHAEGEPTTLEVPHTADPGPIASGSAFFFGVISTDRPVLALELSSDGPALDGFGVDEVVVARPKQVLSGLFEGETAALAPATFTDPEPDQTHTASVAWGGEPDPGARLEQGPGAGTVASRRAFPDDADTAVEVCVTDSEGATGCDASPVEVQNLPPRIECSVEGSRLLGVLGDGTLVENDPLTGEQTVIADTGFSSWGGLDWHPQRGTLYGIPNHTTNPRLATLDPATGAVEIIGPILLGGAQVGFAEALAFDPHGGGLIAAVSVDPPGGSPFDFSSELLVSLDPDTAEATLIGSLGETSEVTSSLLPGQGDADDLEFLGSQLVLLDANGVAPLTASLARVDERTGATEIVFEGEPNVGTLAHDENTGLLFAAQGLPEPALFRIDPDSGAATLIQEGTEPGTLAVVPAPAVSRVLAANAAGQFFEIDPTVGSLSVLADTGIPGWDSMAYHPVRRAVYAITGVTEDPATTRPTLTVVDPATGEARAVAPIVFEGRPLAMAEAVAFDPVMQSLVVAGSIESDRPPGVIDRFSETLLRVDPDTGIASDPRPLGPTREPMPDADDLATFRGRLVALDGNIQPFASVFEVAADGGTVELGRFDPVLIGAIAGDPATSVLYGASFQAGSGGFYRLDPGSPVAPALATRIGELDENLTSLATVPGPPCSAGGLFGLATDERRLLRFDLSGGPGRDLGVVDATEGRAEGLAYDPIRGALFGLIRGLPPESVQPTTLVRIDPVSGDSAAIGEIAFPDGGVVDAVLALAYRPEDGRLYAAYASDSSGSPTIADAIGLLDLESAELEPLVVLADEDAPRGDGGVRPDLDAIEWVGGELVATDAVGTSAEASFVYRVDLDAGAVELVGVSGAPGEEVSLLGLAASERLGTLFAASSMDDRIGTLDLGSLEFTERIRLPVAVGNIAFAASSAQQGSLTAAEGDAASLALRFTDAGVLDTHTAEIDWGDGTVEPAVARSRDGTGLVGGSHVYPQDGDYDATVCVSDDDGGEGCTTLALLVLNAAPESEAIEDRVADVGGAVEVATRFVDPGRADTHTATVDWGDGVVEDLVVVPDARGGSVFAGRVYAERGSYDAELCVADDAGDRGCTGFSVLVNGSPSIVSIPPTETVPGASYRYAVAVEDEPGDAATFSLDTGPPGMTIDPAAGVVSWTPLASQLGDQAVTVRVVDARGLPATQSFVVAVVPDTVAPTVSIELSADRIDPGGEAILTVSASDNGAPPAVVVTVGGIPVLPDPDGRASIPGAVSGVLPIEVTVTDGAGNTTTATTALAVTDPTDTTPPVAALEVPTDLAEVTYLEDLIGTATDSENFFRYQLGIAAGTDEPFRLLAEGFEPVVAGRLGILDPTLLENGIHRIGLVAEDVNGALAVDERAVRITGAAKVGALQLSFLDLAIPLSGVDIELLRRYDTRRRGRFDDFGFGWQLELRAGRVSHNRPPGQGWILSQTGAFDFLCSQTTETRSHLTEVRLSETESYVFKLGVDGIAAFSGGCEGEARFDSLGGTQPGATLTILSGRSVLYLGGDQLVDPDDLLPYEPTRLRLRTRDGREIDFDTEAGGVVRIADANGNELAFLPGGILHSSGASIVFQRDAEGRIETVTDPDGGELRYDYDARGDLVTFTDAVGGQASFRYDDGHRLVDYVDRAGTHSVSEYDADGRWIGASDDDGRLVALEYDLDNRIVTTTNALGEPTTREYDPEGNILREIDANGSEWTYTYGAEGRRLSETDPTGATTTWVYDSAGDLERRTDPLGGVVAYARDAAGRILEVTLPPGEVEQHEYDAVGNRVLHRDAEGNETRWIRDALRRTTEIVHPDGLVERFSYDARGNLVTETGRDGAVRTHAYDAMGRRVSTELEVTGPGGPEVLRTSFEYDGAGRVTSTTDPEGEVTVMAYDGEGREVSRTDPLGRVTGFAYEGDLTARIDLPDGRTARNVFDAASRVAASISADGVERRFEHDPAGRLVAWQEPDPATGVPGTGAAGTFEYAPTGLASAWVDARGGRLELEHDVGGRPVLLRDALGNETRIAYDALGREVSRTDPLGRTTSRELDGRGNPTAITHPDGSVERFEYDARDNLTRHTDALGRETTYTYDGADRLRSVTDALGGVTTYDRDEAGRLVAITDAKGQVTRFEVDGNGRRTAVVRPLGQRSERRYDAAGQLIEAVDFEGDRLDFVYDAGGRLLSRTGSDGSAVGYDHDANGRRGAFTDDRGTTTFAYDGLGRLVARTEPDGRSLAWGYDEAGRVTSLAAPSGVRAVSYDPLGRLSRVTGPGGEATLYAYDAAGQLVLTTLPDGSVETRTYDARGRVLSLVRNAADGSPISSFVYAYDAAGNTLSVDEADGSRIEWSYDALDRLVEERFFTGGSLARTVTYGYDAVGNRVFRNDSLDGLTTYTYDANDRLLSENGPAGAVVYAYDANGQRILRDETGLGATTYGWDLEGRLVSRDDLFGGGRSLSYDYDADGVRVTVVEDGAERRHLVDTTRRFSRVVEERTPVGDLVASYVHGVAPISVEAGSGETRVYGLDRHSGVRSLAALDGTVTDEVRYDAFGNPTSAIGSFPKRLLYRGERQDPVTGLTHLRARDYDPRTGRFLSPDPFFGRLESPVSLHRYLYANANPLRFVDPGGQFSLPQLGVSLAAAGILSSAAALAQVGITRSFQSLRDDVEWRGNLITIGAGFVSDYNGAQLDVSSSCVPNRSSTGGTERLGASYILVLTGVGAGGDFAAGGVAIETPGVLRNRFTALVGFAALIGTSFAAPDVAPVRGERVDSFSLSGIIAGSGIGDASGRLDGIAASIGLNGGVSMPIWPGYELECELP